MKKLRLLLCLLIVVCIIASSSITFSAMPKGKFPIRIVASRDNPTKYDRELLRHLELTFKNSPNFRVTNIDENRLILMFKLTEYIPSVISNDSLATASPINTFTLVWLAKPKGKHAYFIWYDSGRYFSYDSLVKYILEQAETMVWSINNEYPHLFD
jgi:hypothetical protein